MVFGFKKSNPKHADGSSASGRDLISALIQSLEKNLRATAAPDWKPLKSQALPNRKRCEALLDHVFSIILPNEKDYFVNCRERYLALLSLLEPLVQPGWRVLDVGCAPGHMAMALDQLGCRINGLDLNDQYLSKYPTQEWVEKLAIQSVAIEQQGLPFGDATFEALLFTEVLEHVAIKHPRELFAEFKRVLKPGGRLLLSTPNFANVSQLLAFSRQRNVMWPPDIFYGGTDRHNREFVGFELKALIESVFSNAEFYLINAEHNWNSATNDEARALSRAAEKSAAPSPIFFNTLVVLAQA